VNSSHHLVARSRIVCVRFTTSHHSGFYHTAISFPELRKRVKIEVTDEEGTRYSLALDGSFTQNKVMRMMELLDLMGQTTHEPPNIIADESTTYGRLLKLIETSYSAKEFSSADIARDYEDQHAVLVPLSTISTYLSRLADRGVLKRQKFGNSWVYRLSHVSSTHPSK
jgi:hypothetical protein